MSGFGDFDTYTVLRLLGAGVFLLIILPGLFAAYRGRLSTGLTHAVIWTGVGLALVAGYTYRDVFKDVAGRVTAELTPAGQEPR